MKILIWLFCASIPSAIQAACRQAGYTLGAVEALILYGPAYWAAFKLCKVYDERKAAKQATEAIESPAPEELPTPQPEPETSIAESPAEPPAPAAPDTPKARFCKLCGDPIDPATRKCTGCSKQYFRPPVFQKKHLAITAGVLVCIAVALLIFNLASRLSAADAQIAELNSQIAELEDTVAEQKRQITIYKRNEDNYSTKLSKKTEQCNELRDENVMLKDLLSFYEENIVFVCNNNPKVYHKFACPYVDAAEGIYSYNIQLVVSWDYKPCPRCYD